MTRRGVLTGRQRHVVRLELDLLQVRGGQDYGQSCD
jgi:hypothetical protein